MCFTRCVVKTVLRPDVKKTDIEDSGQAIQDAENIFDWPLNTQESHMASSVTQPSS